jgi:acetyl esterase
MAHSYDPELAPIIPLLPNTGLEDVMTARAGLDALVASVSVDLDESSLDIDDRHVAGHDGDPDVAVRVYRPRGAAGAIAALVHIHGGGFVVGSIQTEHAAAVQLASTLDIVVVSVEYRLAPEHPFPAGLRDCFAALRWLAATAGELGVDPDRIAVFGQSAGGGLAAGLALYSRDHGGPPLCFQFLGIPELDDRLETHSMRSFIDTPLWNRPSAELSWRYYLGGAASGEVSPYAAPARARDLGDLPPAYVSTMEFDPLRDEGILYALALLQAGVPVELHSYPGTFHGSALVTTAGVSRRMASEQMAVLRKGLG